MNTKPIFQLGVLIIFMISSHSLSAYENFLNMITPYPSGCVTYSVFQNLLYGGEIETLVEGEILLNSWQAPTSVTSRFTLFRNGCAEPNRSVLTVRFEILDDNDGVSELPIIPELSAIIGETEYLFRLTEEPNSWVNNESWSLLVEGITRQYILDIP